MAARDEALKLQDFLEKDFGIRHGSIRTYFSGNKGYHISVVNSKYEYVDQRGRIELVEYLEGKGFSSRQLGLASKRHPSELYYKLPTPDEPGWRGRIAVAIQESTGLSSRDAFASKFIELQTGFDSFLADIVAKTGVRVDTGVTIDTHRIFRMPGTLHDKSGMIKKRCTNIVDSNPFVDAIAFTSEEVKVTVTYSPRFYLMGTTFGPFHGETLHLPMYAAIFLAAKGLALPS